MKFDGDSMNEIDLIYGFNGELIKSYGKEPFRRLFNNFDSLTKNLFDDKDLSMIKKKILNSCRKLSMLHIAGTASIETEYNFIVTQNRDCPALIWDDEIKLLYHLEAMVLFARSALDLGAYVFSYFLLNKRYDSFNDFTKSLLKQDCFVELKDDLDSLSEIEYSWFRLLCGTAKGRALRDKIAHQTTIKIDYIEVDGKADKEFCHVIVNDIPVPLDLFVDSIRVGLFKFFLCAEEEIIKQLSEIKHDM